MHAPHDQSPGTPERRRRQPPNAHIPSLVRRTTTEFGWRHVAGIAVIRLLVAVWLVCLGVILCAFGQWWGVFLFPVAGFVGWLGYQMPRWKQVRDAEAGRMPE